jgi:hypothetical protein
LSSAEHEEEQLKPGSQKIRKNEGLCMTGPPPYSRFPHGGDAPQQAGAEHAKGEAAAGVLTVDTPLPFERITGALYEFLAVDWPTPEEYVCEGLYWSDKESCDWSWGMAAALVLDECPEFVEVRSCGGSNEVINGDSNRTAKAIASPERMYLHSSTYKYLWGLKNNPVEFGNCGQD